MPQSPWQVHHPEIKPMLNQSISTVKAYLLWGPMFVDCQNFAGSLECNLVGNLFVALQCNEIYNFVKRSWGCILVGKGTHEIHEH